VITVVGFLVVGAVGALLRAEAGRRANRAFPTGTLAVNVIGAFALGLLSAASSPTLTVAGIAGLGAMTTFSSFARDAVALLEEHRGAAAVLYVVGTVVLGLTAAGAGLAVAGT
jgi:CrcB protein